MEKNRLVHSFPGVKLRAKNIQSIKSYLRLSAALVLFDWISLIIPNEIHSGNTASSHWIQSIVHSIGNIFLLTEYSFVFFWWVQTYDKNWQFGFSGPVRSRGRQGWLQTAPRWSRATQECRGQVLEHCRGCTRLYQPRSAPPEPKAASLSCQMLLRVGPPRTSKIMKNHDFSSKIFF